MNGLAIEDVSVFTPVGRTLPQTYYAVATGISRARELPVVGVTGNRLCAGCVFPLSNKLVGATRGAHLLSLGFASLFAQRRPWPGLRIVLVFPRRQSADFATHPYGDRMAALDAQWKQLPTLFAAFLSQQFGAEGKLDPPVALFGAHTTGLRAFSAAETLLTDDRTQAVLLIAVDTYCDAPTLEWFDAHLRLKGPHTPTGFVPAESAVSLLLVRPDERRRLAVVSDVAERQEVKSPSIAEALTAALMQSLAEFPKVDRAVPLFVDLNGERARAKEIAFAIPRFSGSVPGGFDVHHPASSVGDVGAATGPLLVALAAYHLQAMEIAGPAAVCTSSDDGTRATAIVTLSGGN